MTRRAIALLLIITLMSAPAALASQALGWELYQTDTVLGPGLSVSSQVLWGDSKQDYRREQYAVYTPGQGTEPLVCYGTSVPATATLTSMAKGLEELGYRVLAGANGDYFVMASGVPLGMVVSYGALRTSSSYHYAVGFDQDGACFVGKPDVSLTAAFHGYTLSISGGYNKSRTAKDGYFLYSGDFGASTKAGGDGVNVVLRPVNVPADYAESQKPGPAPTEPVLPEGLDPDAIWAALEGQPGPGGEAPEVTPEQLEALNAWEAERARYAEELTAWEREMELWKGELAQGAAALETAEAALRIGGGLDCVVESVTRQSGAVSIPQGRLVLSIAGGGDSFLVEEAQAMVPGERVRVEATSPDPRWERAYTALGAYAMILQDGQVPEGLGQSADPRTALGVKADGTVILYTIDGRRAGHSVGASVQQVAKRLQELGCVDAVLFDGGGSTTFGTTGALDASFSVVNKPSEGSQRAVSDALFFVSQEEPTGVLGSVYLQPQSALMLSGARQSLTGLGVDTGYYPMGDEPLNGLSYTVSGPGYMEGNVFVAGGEKGIATVTATASGGAAGTARMTVVATPDDISITDATGSKVTALNLDPGQEVGLNASATWYKLPLLADDSCFAWSMPSELGTVDPYGNVTAGNRAGSGQLTVTAGERSVSIPIAVGGHVKEVDALEGDLSGFGGEDVTCAPERVQVRYGRQSLRVDHPTDKSAGVSCHLPIDLGETWLGCWIYGDGGALTITAELTLEDGSQTAVLLALRPAAGWEQVMVPIPENTVELSGLTFTPGEGATGTVYLDHLISANGPIADATPPTARLTVDQGRVSATLRDNVDKVFDPGRVELTVDGWGVEFSLEGNVLTAQLPQDGLLHRVSLTVRDASGNLVRQSAELAPAEGRELPFGDVAGHWARDYAVYLYDQGVTNGRSKEGEGPVFDPDTNITRGEFATMLCRWLRPEADALAGAGLPFADAGDIPDWARQAVGYLYQTGVLAGSVEADGLYAWPNEPLTRCQAMTMLGRVQARGYAAQSQVFADDGDIPDWARDYVYTLAGQGVVSGYEGKVRPVDHITRGEVAKLLATMW